MATRTKAEFVRKDREMDAKEPPLPIQARFTKKYIRTHTPMDFLDSKDRRNCLNFDKEIMGYCVRADNQTATGLHI